MSDFSLATKTEIINSFKKRLLGLGYLEAVAVFSGEGDEGFLHTIALYKKAHEDEFFEDLRDVYDYDTTVHDGTCDLDNVEVSEILKLFRALEPDGYEDGDGGGGLIVWKIKEDKFRLYSYYNVMDYKFEEPEDL